MQINLIICELDFYDKSLVKYTIVQYELDLTPQVKKIGPTFMDDYDLNIPYIVDTAPNYLAGN